MLDEDIPVFSIVRTQNILRNGEDLQQSTQKRVRTTVYSMARTHNILLNRRIYISLRYGEDTHQSTEMRAQSIVYAMASTYISLLSCDEKYTFYSIARTYISIFNGEGRQ